MQDYKYDIAISLCKQDVDFARKLIKALNPKLKKFFYEDRQEELINKSGPEEFSKIFKEESRVIVILSRNEWSESYYTDIEKNAIIDRTSVKNQGYSFLIVIPMEPGQAPSWYPTTRIYADPRKFDIELLAKFIEFKVADEGGTINPLTSEEYSEYFIDQLKEKREIVQLQNSSIAINKLGAEVEKIRALFNSKVEMFFSNNYGFSLKKKLFTPFSDAYFGINEYLLNFEIQNIDNLHPQVNTQIVSVYMTLSKSNSIIQSEQYKFYQSNKIYGWAIPQPYSGNNFFHLQHLFTEYGNGWYDLKHPITSEELIDKWFILLWKLVKSDFKIIL
jgi:hypothetical protein